jgi:hypothetical protein
MINNLYIKNTILVPRFSRLVAGVPAPFCFWTNTVPWAATGAVPSMINGLKSFMSVRAAWQLLGNTSPSPFA